MAEIDPGDAMRTFRELQGDYVENAGQQINLREYLDYFEPLGSALAKLPDGAGGPFVHQFTDSGGRTIGSLGWVVSAKSKRFGGWKLWGTWASRPMPPVALPVFWSALSDPARVSDWIERANEDEDRLTDRQQWPDLLGELKSTRLRDADFREYLKAELSRAYAVPLPHHHPIEIELTPRMLDLLPWLYLLGPVDPAEAHLQPNRFNGVGYQYILSDDLPNLADTEITREVEAIVDKAAMSPATAWRMAGEFRAWRSRPKTRESGPSRPARRPRAERLERGERAERVERVESSQSEGNEMRTQPSPRKQPSRSLGRAMWDQAVSVVEAVWTPVFQITVLALLAWIAWNVNVLRKASVVPPSRGAETPVESSPSSTSNPETSTVAPTFEPDLSKARIQRIAAALDARPPQGIRVSNTVLAEIQRGGTDAPGKLARVAVEVFLRRNGCFARTEIVDGKFSTAEQRAIRNCAVLQDEGLIHTGTDPDTGRAVGWLEGVVRSPG